LNNITKTSEQLRVTVNDLDTHAQPDQSGRTGPKLETANAAQASANLRDISNASVQPTCWCCNKLDSARVTFQNAQKITSDLDELTGDPASK